MLGRSEAIPSKNLSAAVNSQETPYERCLVAVTAPDLAAQRAEVWAEVERRDQSEARVDRDEESEAMQREDEECVNREGARDDHRAQDQDARMHQALPETVRARGRLGV